MLQIVLPGGGRGKAMELAVTYMLSMLGKLAQASGRQRLLTTVEVVCSIVVQVYTY